MNDHLNYRGYRFPPEIISHAIWLYHRFTLSLRDIEDLLAERDIIVSYETIRRRVFRSAWTASLLFAEGCMNFRDAQVLIIERFLCFHRTIVQHSASR